jgi:hypothetical protein
MPVYSHVADTAVAPVPRGFLGTSTEVVWALHDFLSIVAWVSTFSRPVLSGLLGVTAT